MAKSKQVKEKPKANDKDGGMSLKDAVQIKRPKILSRRKEKK